MTDPNAATRRLATATDPVKPDPKPGFKTSEFWLASIATLLGIVLASGAIPEGGMIAQFCGGILSVLASLGYTASRTSVKK